MPSAGIIGLPRCPQFIQLCGGKHSTNGTTFPATQGSYESLFCFSWLWLPMAITHQLRSIPSPHTRGWGCLGSVVHEKSLFSLCSRVFQMRFCFSFLFPFQRKAKGKVWEGVQQKAAFNPAEVGSAWGSLQQADLSEVLPVPVNV